MLSDRHGVSSGPGDAAQPASMAVGRWMETRGHHRNILDPSLTLTGVGSARDRDGVAVTQLFGG